MRFNRGESGFSLPLIGHPSLKGSYLLPPAEGDEGSPYGWKCTGHLAMAAPSIEACSFHVAVSRRLSEGPNLSTYVKDTSAPAGGTTLSPYDSEAVRKVQNEPSRSQ